MKLFGGLFQRQAKEGYAFAVAEGFRGFGPLIYAELMSYGRDAWIFQSSIAQKLGCSVRTVQRWLRIFRDSGLLRCWRSKKREKPPGLAHAVTCGFSHRVLTQWAAVGQRFRELREQLAAERARRADERRKRYRPYSAAELDAELARTAGPEPPE